MYKFIPEFNDISDHTQDDLAYCVYGNLNLKLYEDIIHHDEPTAFTKKCFSFFNSLDGRKDYNIDNLLVVGVYEGLYNNKKCNDVARLLLVGRSKEVYEHWMINGNIQAIIKVKSERTTFVL